MTVIGKLNSVSLDNIEDSENGDKLRMILTSVVTRNEHSAKLLMTYKKVTKARKRIKGEDYKGKPGLAKNAVLGWIAADSIKISKQGNVSFLVLDENRRTEDKPFGFTRVRLDGVKTVELEAVQTEKPPVSEKRTEKTVGKPKGAPVKNVIVNDVSEIGSFEDLN